MISVACYQDKYGLNSKLTDQLLHDSLKKEYSTAFWQHLSRLTIPSNNMSFTQLLQKFCQSDWFFGVPKIRTDAQR